MRRALVMLAAVAAWSVMPVAWSHEPARVSIVSPTTGSRVPGRQLNIVLTASQASAAATFELKLNGQPVAVDGKVGTDAVFRTHTLEPGRTTQVVVTGLAPGSHELRVVHAEHADASPVPDTVVTFSSADSITIEGGYNVGGVLVAIAAITALGVIVYVVERLRARPSR